MIVEIRTLLEKVRTFTISQSLTDSIIGARMINHAQMIKNTIEVINTIYYR